VRCPGRERKLFLSGSGEIKLPSPIACPASFRSCRTGSYTPPPPPPPPPPRTYTTWRPYPRLCPAAPTATSRVLTMDRSRAIARGTSWPATLNMPFLSASFAEFWRSWHMPLSSWSAIMSSSLGAARGVCCANCASADHHDPAAALTRGLELHRFGPARLFADFALAGGTRGAPSLAWLRARPSTPAGACPCVATTFLTFA